MPVGSDPVDPLALAAVAYLALPGLLFLGTWASPLLALPGLAALAALPREGRRWPLSARTTLLALAGGTVWAVGSTGTHHLLHAAADWQIRDAVLHDLATGDWPVAYAIGDLTWLLRAPLGYYMVPALAPGFAAAEGALFLWTALGLALVLLLLAALARRFAPGRRRAAIGLALLFAGFGGLDVLPNLWLDAASGEGIDAAWGRGGEWWARSFQYSGHVTLLLWAPNHALPGWLPALLLLRHAGTPGFARMAGLPIAAALFWSPLAAFGAALLTVVALVPGGLRAALAGPANWLSLGLALPVALYVTAGSGAIPHGPLLAEGPAAELLPRVALFLAVEVLPWAVPALALRRARLVIASAALLCALPLYVFGPGNEMTMRGGIAPLTVLCVAAWRGLLAPSPWRPVLAVVTALAFAGQATEASIAIAHPPWPASEACSLPEAAAQSVFTDTDWSHYVIPWPEHPLSALLREPVAHEIDPGSVARCWPEDAGP